LPHRRRHRHPHPRETRPGSRLAEEHHACNAVKTALRAIGERENALLKTTFKTSCRVSLDPSRIGDIATAALVILQWAEPLNTHRT
jgi:hypothetical protein